MKTIEKGMYVRTNRGNIDKILLVEYAEEKKQQYPNHPSKSYWRDKIFLSKERYWRTSQNIIKTSHNIKELVQEGDYVNGHLIEMFYDTYNPKKGEYEDILGIGIYTDSNMDCIEEIRPLSTIDIKTIVTHEQMEAMQYIVGE